MSDPGVARYVERLTCVDLELSRTPEDRKTYALEGVGTLRFDRGFGSGAVAEADGRHWRIEPRGFWRRLYASDEAGDLVGAFDRRWRGGGAITWDGREYPLRRASVWRDRYALVDGDEEVALLDAKGWGKRPVKVSVQRQDAVDAGLLLFTAFIVNKLAKDDGSAAATTVATST